MRSKKHHMIRKGTNEHSLVDHTQRRLINTRKYNENRTQGNLGGKGSLFRSGSGTGSTQHRDDN
jgi:hypothetical protein